jgi:ectoine hydroxylase-related dioxygenase (phytanoyl-CoA dioxygenase family)
MRWPQKLAATLKPPRPPADPSFDESWYLQTYPDIASAVAAGAIASGYEHYVRNGRQEGRYPSAGYSEGDRFDDAWYATAYPAADADLQAGRAADLADHYQRIGRFRGYLPNRFAPRPDQPATWPSRFGGLWLDQANAGDLIEGKREIGRITDADAAALHQFREQGFVILRSAIDAALIDAALGELDRAYRGEISRARFECPTLAPTPIAWHEATRVHPAKVLDLHWWSAPIRRLAFAPAVRQFLELIFERRIMATQTLGFLRGSAQGFHQDTTYVPYSLPLQFAASWIALEDVVEGGGELVYLAGSHRLADHLHGGAYKSLWEAERMTRRSDMKPQTEQYEMELPLRATAAGMPEQKFLARKGDVLIWHADLAHGGRPISMQNTRRSLVTHYCPKEIVPLAAERAGMQIVSHENLAYYTSDHYRG